MTTGSSTAVSASVVVSARSCPAAGEEPVDTPAFSSPIAAARAAGLGWSYTTVLSRFSPVAADSRSRSSSVMAESRPISLNVRPGRTSSADPAPSTTAVRLLTSRSTDRPSPTTGAGAGAGAASGCCPVPPGIPTGQQERRWNG